MARRILIVDDEPLKRITLQIELAEAGYEVSEAADAHAAGRILDGKPFDLVVSDVRMPGASGLDLLTQVKRLRPQTEVILMTAYAEVDAAVHAIKHGAHDYITKPFKTQELVGKIERLFAGKASPQSPPETERFGCLVARCQSTRKLLSQARAFAEADRPVLITGEAGAGKDALAEAIHAAGPRRAAALTRFACSSLEPERIELELFGGQLDSGRNQTGRLEQGAGGFFVLDEIDLLPPTAQSRLLRLLEKQELDRQDGSVPTRIDLALLCLSRFEPAALLRTGAMREELFFRLNAASLHVPSLRERPDDIPALVNHFIARRAIPGDAIIAISPVAMETLLQYRWPGNVRELEYVIDRALTLCEGGEIRPEHIVLFSAETGNFEPPGLEMPAGSAGLTETMADIERRLILLALRQSEGNQAKAAQRLGIPRTTLRDKMAKYSITGE